MPEKYEMRQYLAEVAVSAVLRRNIRLPPALREDALESGKSTLISFLCSAFPSKKHPANTFSTAQEVKCLRKRICASAEHIKSPENIAQRARTEGFFEKPRCQCTGTGREQCSLQKEPLRCSTVHTPSERVLGVLPRVLKRLLSYWSTVVLARRAFRRCAAIHAIYI